MWSPGKKRSEGLPEHPSCLRISTPRCLSAPLCGRWPTWDSKARLWLKTHPNFSSSHRCSCEDPASQLEQRLRRARAGSCVGNTVLCSSAVFFSCCLLAQGSWAVIASRGENVPAHVSPSTQSRGPPAHVAPSSKRSSLDLHSLLTPPIVCTRTTRSTRYQISCIPSFRQLPSLPRLSSPVAIPSVLIGIKNITACDVIHMYGGQSGEGTRVSQHSCYGFDGVYAIIAMPRKQNGSSSKMFEN